MAEAIVVRQLGKRFRRYHPNRPTTLQATILSGLRHLRSTQDQWALRNVTFQVAGGQMLGIIGQNGAGKSTLLRLIGGIGRPEEGTVETHGRIDALYDLTAGFHPDLTGRENVFIGGILAGLTRAEVAARFDAVVDFAEVEAAIDAPLRTYSSGMQMRLAFAVAAHAEPDILLIDEVLAVGDYAFQRKCIDRIGDFRAAGCAVVLVSHDVGQVRELCDVALWLRAGCVMAHGPAELVVGQYVASMGDETRRRTPTNHPVVQTGFGAELRAGENRLGSLEVELGAVHLLNPDGSPITELASGNPLAVVIDYVCRRPLDGAVFGVSITRNDNLICFETSTEIGRGSGSVRDGRITVLLERVDLNAGHYFVDVGVYEKEWAYAYDYHWRVYPLTIRAEGSRPGVVCLPHYWTGVALTVEGSTATRSTRIRL